ncbi:hypothetical protein KC887_00635 [Candidatus Kaiserbacteria bacterium]|nr:hypothetical protein [Candidatus Kaiserbacteria bacterium]
MDKQIGLRLNVDARQVSQGAKELAELEKRLQEVSAALKKNKQEAGSTQEYAKLREEQIKLQGAANEVRKEMRQQEQAFKDAKFPKDSIIGLRAEYRKLKREIDGLSSADPEFEKKAKQAEQLSNQINELSKQAGSYKDNIGRYAQDIGGLFGNVGALAGGLATGGGIVAGLEILKEGAQVVLELTGEMVKLRGEIQQLTGATGAQLDGFASKLTAVANTFGKDTQELLVAANALAKAYDIDLGEALDRISDGFLAGADAQGEFLDKVREYPVQLKNAGFSVEEFIKLATQEVKEGIYSDKLIDTLKESDLALKEFTKAQRDALVVLGPEFANQLEQDIKNGEVTVKDAIIRIATQAKASGADLQQLQTITADVFKGAGEDVGGFQKISEVVFNALEQDYGDLIDTQNEFVQQQQRLLEVNQDFADAQVELAKELGAVDGSLKTVGVQIKTGLLEGLIAAIQGGKQLLGIFQPLLDAFARLGQKLGLIDTNGKAAEKAMQLLSRAGELAQLPLKALVATITFVIDRWADLAGIIVPFLERIGVISKAQEETSKQQKAAAQSAADAQQSVANAAKDAATTIVNENAKAQKSLVDLTARQAKLKDEILDARLNGRPYAGLLKQYNELTREIENTNKVFEKQGKAAEKLASTSLAYMQQKVQELRTELSKAPDAEAYARISIQILKLEGDLDKASAAYQRFADAQRGITAVTAALDPNERGATIANALPGTAQEGINAIVQELDLERRARLENAEETEKLIAELREKYGQQAIEQRKAQFNEQLALEESFAEQRRQLFDESFAEIGEALFSFLGDQNANFKDYLKELLTVLISSVEKTILLTTVEAQAKVIAANAGIPGVGIAKGLLESGLIAGVIKGLFAAVKATVQSFHTGGRVLTLEELLGVSNIPTLTQSGTIRHTPNISGQPGGDNVLARVKVGELILNEQQQLRLRSLAGQDIFKRLGVPGLNTGGFAVPQLVNPNGFIAGASLAPVAIDPGSLRQQADLIAQEVGASVRISVEEAIYDATERTERKKALAKNIEL